MSNQIAGYKALIFDCYGTLIDWESGIWDAFQPLLMANRADHTRDEVLRRFAAAESAQEAATPAMLYPEILRLVHRQVAGALGLETTDALDGVFSASVPHWPAFADTADALRILKRHYKLVILSNVHREGFSASNARLGVEFDAIYTAQDVGSYKPDPANFAHMLDHVGADLGIERGDILHTAQSLFHDHVPAAAAGLARCWIDRQNLAGGGNWGATAVVDAPPEVDFRFRSMMAMAEAVEAAVI